MTGAAWAVCIAVVSTVFTAFLARDGLSIVGDSSRAATHHDTVQLHAPGRLVAVPDLHGDLQRGVQVLRALGIVNGSEPPKWVATNTTVVQLGDLMDRGPHSMALVRLMADLQAQAAALDSELILLLGNHELMNMDADYRYVSHQELLHQAVQGAGAKAAAEAHVFTGPQATTAEAQLQSGLEAWRVQMGADMPVGRLVRSYKLLIVAGTGPCRTLFVHAGLTQKVLGKLLAMVKQPNQADSTPSADHHGSALSPNSVSADDIAAINALVAEALATCNEQGCTRPQNQRRQQQQQQQLQLQSGAPGVLAAAAVLFSSKGPVWSRELALGRSRVACRDVRQVLAAVGAAQMVVGHTVQPQGRMQLRCGAQLVLADVGLSRAVKGSAPAAWECTNGRAAPVYYAEPPA